MTDMEEVVEMLLARVQRLEDEAEIIRIVSSYGPLVDAGEADRVADLWATEGVYEVERYKFDGRQAIHDMVLSPEHQHLITNGCSHFLGPAYVTIDGDTAVAVCESLLLRIRDGAWSVRRAGANHWRLERFDDGWKVVYRTTSKLDAGESARKLLVAYDEGTR